LTFLGSQSMDASFSFDKIGGCHATHLSATVPAGLEPITTTSFRAWRYTVSDQTSWIIPPLLRCVNRSTYLGIEVAASLVSGRGIARLQRGCESRRGVR
jgi:hypothetical protein